MKLLLDTHVLLWTVFEPHKLAPALQEAIADSHNIVTISIVSLWEIAIKQNIGKLSLPESFSRKVLKESGFDLLLLQPAHIQQVLSLPLHHRDPFDRMLIAQAQAEQLTFVTCDESIVQYEVALLKISDH
jgi:PIN domain nuclease of toxin-antitoxin system